MIMEDVKKWARVGLSDYDKGRNAARRDFESMGYAFAWRELEKWTYDKTPEYRAGYASVLNAKAWR